MAALPALWISLLAVPAAAQDDTDAECMIDAAVPAAIEGELAAVEQAVACGREVEVTDQRNEFGTVLALPSGELKAQMGVEPIQALDESGAWAPIDTTLEVAGDGSVRPVNITEDLTLSPGGTAPMAAVGYGSEGAFSLSWPGELPAPVLDGPQAIYNEVLTGVDLVVEATAQGFRYDLVVADAEAAQNPDLEAIAFPVEAAGVEVTPTATGAVEVKVAGKAEMASGEALMWEAPVGHDMTETVPELTAITDTPSDPDQEIAAVEVALESEDLVLRPDLELLRGEDTRYPVVIDPQWDGGIQGNVWGLVNTKYRDDAFYRGKNSSGADFMSNTGTYGNAGAGQTCDSWSELDCYSSTYDMRSIFRMDTDSITQNAYRIPNKGLFKIVQRHSASCTNGTAKIWRTGTYNSGDTWDTQPTWYDDTVTISTANNGVTCGGSAWVEFNVTSMLKTADAGNWANLTLGLRAPDESPSPELLQWNRFDADTAVLEMYYDIRPYSVKDPMTNGFPCTSAAANAPWINDRTPTLSAQYGSLDDKIKYNVRVRNSITDAIIHQYTSNAIAADTRHPYTLPVANQLADGLYHWHTRSISPTNTAIASDWTDECRIKVDGTKPSTPTITPSADAPYEIGETSLSLTVKSTDPVPTNGVASGIAGFKYYWDDATKFTTKESTGTLELDPNHAAGQGEGLTAGRHVLYIQSYDKAGNLSNTRTYTFFAGRDILATPKAAWRLEGDTVDDTGEGFGLVAAPTETTYGTDADGRAGAAANLDGATCLTSTSEDDTPLIRTDAAYSITAWAYVTEGGGTNPAIVTKAGNLRPGFYLEYIRAENKWNFTVPKSDASSTVFQSLRSTTAAKFNTWTHLAATMDPDTGVMRLYVNGVLNAERVTDPGFTAWDAKGPVVVGCAGRSDGERWHHLDGAVDQVGVWQGLLTTAQIQAAMKDLPGASVQADWTFKADGTDGSDYERHLNTDNVVAGTDAHSRPSGELELDGSSCLEYPEPVIDTTRSFTVAGWAMLDSTSTHATVISTSGENTTAMRLRYSSSVDKWVFMIADQDSTTTTSPEVRSKDTVEADRWYHLTGTFDATTKELKLYVDGVLQGTRTGVTSAWNATGPTILGCAGAEAGPTRWDELNGSLHKVSLWRGVVNAAQIETMMGNPPATDIARWDFNNYYDPLEAAPTPRVDLLGNGHDLTVTGSEYYDFGRNWAQDNAFWGIDGTSHARTVGPVVATDESFTIATWMRADDLTRDGVAVSITGASRSTVVVKYSAANARWEFAAPPTAGGTWSIAGAAAAPLEKNNWYVFLVGVYDLPANELRLYIDGVQVASVADVVLPASTGSLVIGAEGNADGTVRDGLIGAVDDTIIWQGALDCATIAGIYNPQLPEQVCGA